jgi:hypothetical protein
VTPACCRFVPSTAIRSLSTPRSARSAFARLRAKRPAEQRHAATRRLATALVAQPRRHIDPRRAQRGKRAEDDTGRSGQQHAEDEQTLIEADVQSCNRQRHLRQELQRPYRHAQARGTPQPREHQRLQQQQSDDAPATRAERLSHRQLRTPRHAPDQQQIAQVAAREQKHQTRHHEQAQSRSHQQAVDIGMETHIIMPEDRDAAPFVQLRPADRQAMGQSVHGRLCPLRRHTGRQSRLHLIPVILASIQIRNTERTAHRHARDRHPEVRHQRSRFAVERLRPDADDGDRHIVQADRAADDVRVRAHLRAPRAMAHDRHHLLAHIVMLRLEPATALGHQAEHREIARTRELDRDRHRAARRLPCHIGR